MGKALPTGTVTFLFTDIEGSTQLVQRLGPDYRGVLERHAEIISGSIDDHDGVAVNTEGDSFFAAFEAADAAVLAASSAQQALSDEPWPDAGAVRVRAGIHTGKAELGHDDYVGLDVHRAARISGAGHGGQVLASATTHALAIGVVDFRDLGEHRLKDLVAAEHLYQVLVPGLPAEFPPIRSVGVSTHNLPASLSALVGREREVSEVAQLLESQRMVTITGPGGIGKSRLSLEVARNQLSRFSHGVYLVALAPVTDAALVLPSIGDALDLADGDVDSVTERIGSGSMLLLLDNLEQVLDAATDIAALLGRCPGLVVLGTSQAPLRIPGEHQYPLQPLELGASGSVSHSPAATLFIERARAIDPAFDPEQHRHGIETLVARLDGLPLALELAAAKVNLMPPDQIAERLGAGTDLLSRTGDGGRHGSVNAAIGFSYQLLGQAAQSVFRRLAAFRGGMTLEAAEAVAGDGGDVLSAIGELVERGMLLRQISGMSSSRFRMLEPVRLFAVAALEESGEAGDVAQAHAAHFSHMARNAGPELEGERMAWWLARLEEELDNLRAALDHYADTGRPTDGLELIGDTWRFFQGKGHFDEMAWWLDRLDTMPGAGNLSTGRVKGLMARGALTYWRGDAAAAIDMYDQAVGMARKLDDADLLATALYGHETSRIMAGDAAGLEGLKEVERIYQENNDLGGLAHVAAARAFAELQAGRALGSGPLFQEAFDLYVRAGNRLNAGQTSLGLAGVALLEDRVEDALQFSRTGLEYGEELGDRFMIAWAIEWVATALVEAGDIERAGKLSGATAAAREKLGGGWTPAIINVDDSQTRLIRVLGEKGASEARQPGRDLSLDAAINLAKEPP